jgi:hypothetical protein
MAAAPTALARTSTDTLVTALGRLHHSIGQVALTAAGTGVIPPAETLLGLDYVRAHAEVAELLDARLARS